MITCRSRAAAAVVSGREPSGSHESKHFGKNKDSSTLILRPRTHRRVRPPSGPPDLVEGRTGLLYSTGNLRFRPAI